MVTIISIIRGIIMIIWMDIIKVLVMVRVIVTVTITVFITVTLIITVTVYIKITFISIVLVMVSGFFLRLLMWVPQATCWFLLSSFFLIPTTVSRFFCCLSICPLSLLVLHSSRLNTLKLSLQLWWREKFLQTNNPKI